MNSQPDWWKIILNEEGIDAFAPVEICAAFWEDYATFRESFLMYVTEPALNAALRTVGETFLQLVLKHRGHWPGWPDSATHTKLRAAVADLRHLQGFLASVGQERSESSLWPLSPEDARLSSLAEQASALVELIGSRLDIALEGSDGGNPRLFTWTS